MKPGQTFKADLPEGEFLHLSQICLQDPKAGKNYVQVQIGGKTINLVCLEKDKVEHQAVDLIFGPDSPSFLVKGSSEVHLAGYMEPNEDDMGEEDEEEKGKGTAAKASLKAAPKASPKATPKASPKAAQQASPKAAAKTAVSPKVAAAAAAAVAADEEDDDDDENEEGEEEEEGEESEEEEKPAAAKASPKVAPKASPKACPKVAAKAAEEEDDDDEEGEEEEEEEEEGEEEEEEAAAPPAKKAKTEPKGAVKASAKADTASPDAEYLKSLVDFLQKNGNQKLSELGSKVKRPAGVPKMGSVLKSNQDMFAITGDTVSLKK